MFDLVLDHMCVCVCVCHVHTSNLHVRACVRKYACMDGWIDRMDGCMNVCMSVIIAESVVSGNGFAKRISLCGQCRHPLRNLRSRTIPGPSLRERVDQVGVQLQSLGRTTRKVLSGACTMRDTENVICVLS